jgi:hypothetical protein
MYWWQKLSWWLLMSYKWKMYHEMYTRPTRLLIYRILWQVKNDKIVKSILQCFIYLFPSDTHYSARKNATITLTALVGLVATRMVNAWNLAFYQMTAKKHQHTMEVIKSHQIWVKYGYYIAHYDTLHAWKQHDFVSHHVLENEALLRCCDTAKCFQLSGFLFTLDFFWVLWLFVLLAYVGSFLCFLVKRRCWNWTFNF